VWSTSKELKEAHRRWGENIQIVNINYYQERMEISNGM